MNYANQEKLSAGTQLFLVGITYGLLAWYGLVYIYR